jgi:uncharacterized protein YciI
MDGSWFCYVLRPTRPDILETGPTAEEAELTGRHWQYTLGLHEEGRLAVAGRTTTPGDTFAVIVVRAEDEAAARTTMEADPGVAEGLFQAVLHPFELLMLDGKLDP